MIYYIQLPALPLLSTGMVEDAMLPYSEHVSSDTPSMEEMREVAHVRELRPSVCDQWNCDEVRSRMLNSVGLL